MAARGVVGPALRQIQARIHQARHIAGPR
jgi:hypothetical protein